MPAFRLPEVFSPLVSLLVSFCWMVCPPSRGLVSPCLLFVSHLVTVSPCLPLSPIVSHCLPTCVPVLDDVSSFPRSCLSLSPIVSPHACLCWMVSPAWMVCLPSLPLSPHVLLFPFVSHCLWLSPPHVCLCWMVCPPSQGLVSLVSLVSQLVSQLVSLLVSLCGGWSQFAFSPNCVLWGVLNAFLRSALVLDGVSTFPRSCLPSWLPNNVLLGVLNALSCAWACFETKRSTAYFCAEQFDESGVVGGKPLHLAILAQGPTARRLFLLKMRVFAHHGLAQRFGWFWVFSCLPGLLWSSGRPLGSFRPGGGGPEGGLPFAGSIAIDGGAGSDRGHGDGQWRPSQPRSSGAIGASLQTGEEKTTCGLLDWIWTFGRIRIHGPPIRHRLQRHRWGTPWTRRRGQRGKWNLQASWTRRTIQSLWWRTNPRSRYGCRPLWIWPETCRWSRRIPPRNNFLPCTGGYWWSNAPMQISRCSSHLEGKRIEPSATGPMSWHRTASTRRNFQDRVE